MGARNLGAVVGIGVERVFDDVVPGDAASVDEQLTGEFAEAEAAAHLGAVDHDGLGGVGKRLAPFGQHAAPSPSNSISHSVTPVAPWPAQ